MLISGQKVETMGLEPTTPCLQSRCSSQLSYVPEVNGSACFPWSAALSALAGVDDRETGMITEHNYGSRP